MNEKEKKSLIIISSVFIFVLVFMVFFTFYRRDAMLSDRTIPKINTEIVEEDPPALGDAGSCVKSASSSNPACTSVNCSNYTAQGSCNNSYGCCTWKASSTSGTKTPTPKPTAVPTPKPATRPATCLSKAACENEAGRDCMYGSNGCTKYGNDNGFDCYKFTCKSNTDPTASPNSCSIGNCLSYSCRSNSCCKCETCRTGYHPSGSSCIADSATPTTPSCCYESNGKWLFSETLTNCPGVTGLSRGECDAKNTASTPTPTPGTSTKKKCCYNGTTIEIDKDKSCSLIGGAATEGACPTTTATPNSIQCWSLTQSDKCSFVTVNGLKCDNSRNNYDTYAQCIGHITCGSSQVRNGGVCTTCSAIDSNSEPNSDNTVCVCKSGYAKINGKCVSETSITAPCCIDGKTSNDSSECKVGASSGKTVTSGNCPTYKCCCNLASGHCSMATTCTGSLITTQGNITSAASCNALDAGLGSACYYNESENEYVWGVYGNMVGYKYTVALNKNSCTKYNDVDNSSNVCVLRCPSSSLNIGEEMMCTFESSDGSTLADTSNHSSSSVDNRFVKVTADSTGTINVSGISSSGCVTNDVAVTVYDRNDDKDNCKLTSVVTNSKLVSEDVDGYPSNSYYVVCAKVEGTGCNKDQLIVTENNGAIVGNHYSNIGDVNQQSVVDDINGQSGSYCFHVYPKLGCDQTSTTNVTLRNANGEVVGNIPVTVDSTSDWSPQENVCVKKGNASYTSFLEADIDGASEYYSNWDAQNDCYTVKWTRGCGTGGGGGSSVTPTPSNPPKTTYACYANAKDLINATSAVWATGSSSSYPYLISGKNQSECKAYACFVNSDGTDYKWANSTPSGYKKVDNILSQSLCKKEEDACYIDKSGEYHWGKYKNNSDYTFVASITNESKCKKNDDAACYSNGDKFVWDVTPPDDTYIKVPDMDTSVKCAKDDNGCFLHDNKYYWGNYFNKSDYYFVAGITEQDYCSNYGCYYNGSEYVWGDYSDDDSYQLVKDIIDRAKCGYTPDVPMTSLNVQTIVYIAVAVMSVFGIYFVVRYNNKSKNI